MRTKCYKCRRPDSNCLCKSTKPINTNTQFIVLMHPMEFKKEKNGTGLLTTLQLTNSKKIIGIDFTHNEEVNELINNLDNQCYLLYPGDNSINLSGDKAHLATAKRHVIFIIDGTWPCAKKMLKLSDNLKVLEKISFNNHEKSKFLIKQQPSPQCLSTIESTYLVLKNLKRLKLEELELDSFLNPFHEMIKFQIECIKNPPKNSYRQAGKRNLLKKDRYKPPHARTIFYRKES